MKQEILPENSPARSAQPSAGAVDTSTLELLEQWRQDDAPKNSEEVRAAERELSEFKKTMNESRAEAGEPPLYQ